MASKLSVITMIAFAISSSYIKAASKSLGNQGSSNNPQQPSGTVYWYEDEYVFVPKPDEIREKPESEPIYPGTTNYSPDKPHTPTGDINFLFEANENDMTKKRFLSSNQQTQQSEENASVPLAKESSSNEPKNGSNLAYLKNSTPPFKMLPQYQNTGTQDICPLFKNND